MPHSLPSLAAYMTSSSADAFCLEICLSVKQAKLPEDRTCCKMGLNFLLQLVLQVQLLPVIQELERENRLVCVDPRRNLKIL